MPYIPPDKRDLAAEAPINVGELTYAITRRIQSFLQDTPLSYEQIALVLGALEGAKADFIQRVMMPYEEKKRQENGDVW